MSKHNRGREPRPSARGTVLVLEKVYSVEWGTHAFVVPSEDTPENAKTFTAIFTEDPFKEPTDGQP